MSFRLDKIIERLGKIIFAKRREASTGGNDGLLTDRDGGRSDAR
jgi:hypothetical protein